MYRSTTSQDLCQHPSASSRSCEHCKWLTEVELIEVPTSSAGVSDMRASQCTSLGNGACAESDHLLAAVDIDACIQLHHGLCTSIPGQAQEAAKFVSTTAFQLTGRGGRVVRLPTLVPSRSPVEIDVSFNYITGSLPASLSKPKKLQILWVASGWGWGPPPLKDADGDAFSNYIPQTNCTAVLRVTLHHD
jgi:hypothetical protein